MKNLKILIVFCLIIGSLLGCSNEEESTEVASNVSAAIIGKWKSDCLDFSASDGGPLASSLYRIEVKHTVSNQYVFNIVQDYFQDTDQCLGSKQEYPAEHGQIVLGQVTSTDPLEIETDFFSDEGISLFNSSRPVLYTTARIGTDTLEVAVSRIFRKDVPDGTTMEKRVKFIPQEEMLNSIRLMRSEEE
jgi:hypothetical protein